MVILTWMLRYFPDSDSDKVGHDVSWAIANVLGGGCELEVNEKDEDSDNVC